MSGVSRAYRFWRDPICVGAMAAYALNRWLVPLSLKGAFLRGHFADLLLLPAALPLWLWVERRVGLRAHDDAPRWSEIAAVFVMWSVAAEVIAPRVFAGATGDVWDVVAYACGAIAAGLAWRVA